jgi:YD repeat-containing protein
MVIRSFGYDSQGRQNQIVDENGNAITMTFDARGNVTSRKTCRAAGRLPDHVHLVHHAERQ